MYRNSTTLILSSSVIFCGLFLGCGGKKDPTEKPTYRVTGSVTVDGEIPDTPLQLVCHPKGGEASGVSRDPSCDTKDDGTFEFITYKQGDGVPSGEYVITVTWKEFDLIKREYRPADKLKGRYSDPKTSKIELTVDKKSVDLGTLELTTK